MKTAVSVSLGHSSRDKKVEVELYGEKVLIERRGTDGDVEKATALFEELDGKVDALGVGGIDLWVEMGDYKFPLTAAQKMVENVKQTPVVDGSGLKNTLERQAAQTLVDELGPSYRTGRVLHTVAVDRYGMALGFFDLGYETVCGDLMFTLGVPIPVRSLKMLNRLGRALGPIIARLPISVLYPTGEKQEEIIPKFTRYYDWANVIAGDCHLIKRHMPDDLGGKVIVTNTTTEKDMELFRERGVDYVLTTTPVLDGRSFGTNMLEAALTAVADKGRPLTHEELTAMLIDLDLKPTLNKID
ncbi:MAG: quinate 5-dehydrogenase [Candidatus Promineifilaceae bacterium]|jgi:hypothetical protein